MPTLGPQDVESIMDLLESVQRAEAQGKVPAGSYQRYLNQFESEFEFNLPSGPRGEQGFTGRLDGQVTRAPWRGEHDMPGNFERRQKMANSMAEDAAMRESMRYSRKRGEDEPEGSYALSNYPGAALDIARVEGGFGSWGHAANFMDPQERMALQEKAKSWGQHQRKLLGMNTEDAGDFRGRRQAERGMQGRDRMRYLMRRR